MIDVNHTPSIQCARCVRVYGRLLRNGTRQKKAV